VNPASPTGILRPRFPRDPTNQPGLVFPQSPGIILETFGHALLVVAVGIHWQFLRTDASHFRLRPSLSSSPYITTLRP
jgi:hypothetical protein